MVSLAIPTAAERFSTQSRYRLSKIRRDTTLVAGRLRVGVWRIPEIAMDEFDWHVVRDVDIGRIDLIASQTYGNPSYWWVIAYVNHIRNPLTDLVMGQTLKLPKVSAITRALTGFG